MDGIKLGNTTLFIGKLPGRKQECFYFAKGTTFYPVAYISNGHLGDAKRLWGEMLDGVTKLIERLCG